MASDVSLADSGPRVAYDKVQQALFMAVALSHISMAYRVTIGFFMQDYLGTPDMFTTVQA